MAYINGSGREETWEKLQERLQKARRKQSTASSTRSSGKGTPHPRNGYRRTPPPKHLPSLDTRNGYRTPPVDTPVSGFPGNLRTSSYEVVPPLIPREDAFERDPYNDRDYGYTDYHNQRNYRDNPYQDYYDPHDRRNYLDPRQPRDYARHNPTKKQPSHDRSSHYSKPSTYRDLSQRTDPKSKSVVNGYSHNPSRKSKHKTSILPEDLYSGLRYNGYKPSAYASYPYTKSKKKKKVLVRYRKTTDTGSDTSSRTSSAVSQPAGYGYLPGEEKYLQPGQKYLPIGEQNQYTNHDPQLQYINPLPTNPYISPRGPITYLTVGDNYANPDEPRQYSPNIQAMLLDAEMRDDTSDSGRQSKYDYLESALKGKKKRRRQRRQRYSTPDEAAVAIQSAYRGYAVRRNVEPAKYLGNGDFAQGVVNEIIDEFLVSEAIPDMLIEVLTERKYLPKEHPAFIPAVLACEDIVDETVEEIAEEVVVKMTSHMVDKYMTDKWDQKDYIEEYSDELVDQVVTENIELVVADTIEDLVQDHLNRAAVYDAFVELYEDIEKPYVEDAVREAIFEVILEDYIDDFVNEEVQNLHKELAEETLARYDAAVIKKQHREVATHAGDVVIDSFFLDYLLTMIARNGKIWTEREYFDKFLDAMTLDVLLSQYFNIRDLRKLTEDHKALKHFHEDVVTDVLTNALVTELSEQLDEDMEDLHEYEIELDKPDEDEEETPRYSPAPPLPMVDLSRWMGKNNLLKPYEK
ncbi:uncharacterized protein LOC144439821 [Glandiceps talaboti]